MSGASWRLRWFIWNSHSKSEITRSPFTIVVASCLRAKSTTSSEKTSTTTLLEPGRARPRGTSTRSSTVNSVCLCVRVADDADDDAVEDRRGAADHVDVAVRDGVVACPGQMAVIIGEKTVIRAEP